MCTKELTSISSLVKSRTLLPSTYKLLRDRIGALTAAFFSQDHKKVAGHWDFFLLGVSRRQAAYFGPFPSLSSPNSVPSPSTGKPKMI